MLLSYPDGPNLFTCTFKSKNPSWLWLGVSEGKRKKGQKDLIWALNMDKVGYEPRSTALKARKSMDTDFFFP